LQQKKKLSSYYTFQLIFYRRYYFFSNSWIAVIRSPPIQFSAGFFSNPFQGFPSVLMIGQKPYFTLTHNLFTRPAYMEKRVLAQTSNCNIGKKL
jgi:hypothetical protein